MTKAKKKADQKTRLYLELDPDLRDQVDYWQRKKGFASRREFLTACVELYIAIQNQDYDLPTAEIARLNQMVEAINNNTDELHALRKSFNNAFDTILNLTEDTDK